MKRQEVILWKLLYCALITLVLAASLALPIGLQSAHADVYVQNYDFREMQPYEIELRPSSTTEFGVYDYVKEGITKLMVFSPEEMYGISVWGSLVAYQGNDKWTCLYSGYQSDAIYDFSDIWGSSKSNTYLVNNNGLYLYNGITLTSVSGVENPARVWGAASDDVYVARSDAGLYHYNGSTWSLVDYFSGRSVTCLGSLSVTDSVYGSVTNAVYAGAADGLHYFDGSAWTPVTPVPAAGKAATCIGKTADGNLLVCYGKEVTCLDSGGQWTSLGQTPFAASKIMGTALDDLYGVIDGKLYLRKNDGNWYKIQRSDGSLLADTVYDFHVFARRDFLVAGLDAPIGGYYFTPPILYHGSVIPAPPPVNYDQEVTAYLRVEGYDRTIIPRTKITLQAFDLGKAYDNALGPARGIYLNPATGSSANEYSEGWGLDRFENGPTALHIQLKALTDQGFSRHDPANPVDGPTEFDVQDYGWSLYVAMVGGDREFDRGSMSGWLYRVNGWLPNYGSQAYNLEDGDEVVWYYSPTGFDTWYVNFEADREDVGPGETVHFTLTGETTDLSGASGAGDTVFQPIAGASILVNGQTYQAGGSPLITDAEGKAAITFDTAGTYEVSCEGWNIFGAAGAVRPASVSITVSASAYDTTPPVFASEYPQAEDVTATGFNLKLKMNESGTAYYKVVADGAEPGIDFESWTSVAIPGAGEVVEAISGLTQGQSYDVYVIAEDAAGNLQADPVKLDVTAAPAGSNINIQTSVDASGMVTLDLDTAYPAAPVTLLVISGSTGYYIDQFNTGADGKASIDFSLPPDNDYSAFVAISGEKKEFTLSTSSAPGDTTPPVFASGYPQAEDVTDNGFNLKLNMNESGTAYYKVVDASATPGTEYESWTSITIPGAGEVVEAVSGLAAGQAYDVYVIARDAAGNLQEEPVKLDVTTLTEDTIISRVRAAIAKATNYVKTYQTYSSDWLVVGYRNAGEEIPANYLNEAAADIEYYFATYVNTKLEKVTDHERRVLGVAAAGGDPRNIGGHDLIERIYNFYIPVNEAIGLYTPRDITFQGLNGPIYGLIALDTMRYPIPEDALYSRDYLISYLLQHQNADGGWDLSYSGNSDVDITAMTLIGLAPYHDRADVMTAVNSGVGWLSQKQSDEGGYASWGSYNSESVSQTIIALCANGIDPTSQAFTKNGNNLLDALLAFQREDGAILHTHDGAGETGMATEQGYQALLAYDKFVKNNGAYNGGRTSIYYFGESGGANPPVITGISPNHGPQSGGSKITISGSSLDTVTAVNFGSTPAAGFTPGTATSMTAVSPAGTGAVHVTVVNPSGSSTTGAADLFTYNTPVTGTEITINEDGANKHLDITPDTVNLGGAVNINVPANITDATVNVGTLLNQPAGGSVTSDHLPAVNISAATTLGKIQVAIPQGVTVSAPADADWNGAIQAPTVQAGNTVTVTPDSGKKATVNTVIEIGFGDIPLTFDKAVRLLIPGQAGKEAGYYRDGVFTKITTVMSSDSQAAGDALPAGGDGRIDAGGDLVIWTKHFTRFITYTQTAASSGGGGGGGGGGSSGSGAVTTTTGSANVTPGAGGTVSLSSEAKLEIPAGALQGTSSVEVKIQKAAGPPAAPEGFKALGNTYEFIVGGAATYSFKKPVTLSFTFDPADLVPGEKAKVYYYDQSSSQWVSLGGTVSGNTITVTVDHFTSFAVLARAAEKSAEVETVVKLTDIAGHWAKDNINQLISCGVISGYPDGAFRPDGAVTRAEFLTILVKAFNISAQGNPAFSDTGGHWARDSIAAAVGAGVASGYGDNTFRPDDPITREQLAVMAARAAQLQAAAEIDAFTDSGFISPWAREAVAAIVQANVMKGYPDGTFLPRAGATRAEAVTVIANLLKR